MVGNAVVPVEVVVFPGGAVVVVVAIVFSSLRLPEVSLSLIEIL